MLAIIIILAVLLLLFLATSLWLFTERRSLRSRRHQLENDLVQMTTARDSLLSEVQDLRVKQGVGEANLDAMQRSFDAAQTQLREAFAALASEALNQNSQQFLHLAKKSFEGEQKDAAAQLAQREQAIKAMVDPIKQTLDKYKNSVQEIEKGRVRAFGQLNEQLRGLLEDQGKLRQETGNLVKALRRPEVRGRWGEMQMQRVAELAGMVEYCDFDLQQSLNTEEGRLKPDMVVRLPSGRAIVVDAKTSIDAFIDANEAPDDATREVCLTRHVRQIETQVKSLSSKQYWSQFEHAPDFVVLFIPGESFLQAAVERQPKLFENAMRQNVVIAAPTTLISLLKVVALGWREQQIADNARQVRDLGMELHERLRSMAEHLQKVGSSLESAVKNYNSALGSFETRVLVSARKFEELGAGSSKPLPEEVKQIERMPREIKTEV